MVEDKNKKMNDKRKKVDEMSSVHLYYAEGSYAYLAIFTSCYWYSYHGFSSFPLKAPFSRGPSRLQGRRVNLAEFSIWYLLEFRT